MDNGKTGMGMNILAIETSQPHASLALSRKGVIILKESWIAERNHDAFLFPALQRALYALGSGKPELILVGSGPGSYGGVRVALAAAVGIAQVTGADTAAICSWSQLEESGAVLVSDARRGNWTIRRENGIVEVVDSNDLQRLQAQNVRILTVESADCLQKAGILPDRHNLIPTAEGLIRTWLNMTAEEQHRILNSPREPIYVRPPHITKPLHQPWEIRR